MAAAAAEAAPTAANTSESGIEDGGGSGGDGGVDGGEELRERLETAEGVILDLRTALALATSQDSRKRAAGEGLSASFPALSPSVSVPRLGLGGAGGAEWVVVAGENERLREEAFLLESRLAQKEELIAETVAKYRAQLKETAALGKLVQELWRGGREEERAEGQEPEWRAAQAHISDLRDGLARTL